VFRCKCGTTYQDPLEAAECEAQGHKPTTDPLEAAERLIHVTMGAPGTESHRSYTISESALLMRSLSDQTLLMAVAQIVATIPPVPFHDLIKELAARLDKALIELAGVPHEE